MIETPGDLVSDLPCVQQASYLEGGPLLWILPLYLHVNQKSDDDDDDMMMMVIHTKTIIHQDLLSEKSLPNAVCKIDGLSGALSNNLTTLVHSTGVHAVV